MPSRICDPIDTSLNVENVSWINISRIIFGDFAETTEDQPHDSAEQENAEPFGPPEPFAIEVDGEELRFASRADAERGGYRECEYCGEWRSMGDMLCIDGHWYCDDGCACDAGYESCEYCGEWVHADYAIHTTGRRPVYYCGSECARRSNIVQCADCEEYCHTDDIVFYNARNEPVCMSCEDDYSYCERCNEYVHDDYFNFDQDRCNNCATSAALVHQYGYRPAIEFFGDTDGNQFPYMGVELETDGGNGKREYSESVAAGYGDRLWMTEDGSLSSAGVEITSHPMTLAEHLECGLWEHVRECALYYGYTSHDNGDCGLHIHINRDFFGKSHARQHVGGYNLGILVSRFKSQLTIFSRRCNDHWCSYGIEKDFIGEDAPRKNDGVFQKSSAMMSKTGHAQCVNYEHSQTFEIRIFRGTLRLETLYASMALTHGLARAAKYHGHIWCESVGWYDLVEWIMADLGECDARTHLHNYLHSKELTRVVESANCAEDAD